MSSSKRKSRPTGTVSKPAPVMEGGSDFETFVEKFINHYFEYYGVDGKAYRYPDTGSSPQHVDILVDSQMMGYAGIECKSVFEPAHDYMIQFDNITHTNKNGLNQIVRQHKFLDDTGRYGIYAFEFREMDRAFLVPHRYVYEKFCDGANYITVDEVVQNGYMIGDRGCLVTFVRNKCW